MHAKESKEKNFLKKQAVEDLPAICHQFLFFDLELIICWGPFGHIIICALKGKVHPFSSFVLEKCHWFAVILDVWTPCHRASLLSLHEFTLQMCAIVLRICRSIVWALTIFHECLQSRVRAEFVTLTI